MLKNNRNGVEREAIAIRCKDIKTEAVVADETLCTEESLDVLGDKWKYVDQIPQNDNFTT